MSLLNQSGEEQVECPLCMEPLEVDDLHFYPCTCGYQICRFCWHRIRTDENGLCPACRKAYSEKPEFIPLSKEQVAQLKADKRQRDQQRKAKLTESRKHLASVRVVQRNLVFVVGLPMRLADPEVLKRYEYFGKFGKIHKVVINQSTAYAGTQGPSASAYVTYMKSDDALRAIQNVNNTIIDGKTIKTSLGTTKYCSHFMKNQLCPKPDCMYLHDFGDQEASFTKEQMHAGKHQEYEKKLHDALLSKLAAAQTVAAAPPMTVVTPTSNITTISSLQMSNNTNGSSAGGGGGETQQQKGKLKEPAVVSTNGSNQNNKDTWPQLNNDSKKSEKSDKDKSNKASNKKTKSTNGGGGCAAEKTKTESKKTTVPQQPPTTPPTPIPTIVAIETKAEQQNTEEDVKAEEIKFEELPQSPPIKLPPTPVTILDDNSSFFSQTSFTTKLDLVDTVADGESRGRSPAPAVLHQNTEPLLEIHNDTDSWDFDFGYGKHSNHLEELAKQRITVKGMFQGLDNPSPSQYTKMVEPVYTDTENLLETLAKNSVNYNNHYANGHKESNLESHMTKFFTDFCRNGGYQQQQQQQQQQQHQQQQHQQQQHQLSQNLLHQQHQPQQLNGGFNHQTPWQPYYIVEDNHPLALLQQQRQIEEQLMSLTLNSKQQQQTHHQQHGYGQINGGGFDMSSRFNFGAPGMGAPNSNNASSQLFSGGINLNSFSSNKSNNSRPLHEDYHELDNGFLEAQKALEELVESDSHVHNTGRTNSIGAGQMNGLVHNHIGNHLPPPPPGFVQSNTHMNAFGSKILPFLTMNNQQPQQQQMNNTQNNWPSTFNNQMQQSHQQQQHKGMDWKVLDPAILSSRRHVPHIDHYTNGLQLGATSQPQQNGPTTTAATQQRQQYDSYHQHNGFTTHNGSNSASSSLGFSHLNGGQSLNWLGTELNTQIPTPPGFRTSGQAAKQQQEC
ncbi:PREDICTED: uncharacterized protein LOC108566127 [Nicrophorus vespilloides]|uniref:Uncharacterized protein LOC108566127 n=1 Tax=Nicrophorus vespilloides TaxID=110193 RepID=A0ABM1N3D9_NICVS|nr:PREDICTED: uncharacterized protein LOC108566127 [Nicrophorus vespilloides]